MRLFRLLPSLLLILLFVALPAAAQNAPTESSDAEAFVLQAIANLNALPGYHFAYESQNSSVFTEGEEVVISTFTITSVEGDALANGDNFVTISLASNDSMDSAKATPPLHVERTVFNGNSALNFQVEDTVYEQLLPFEDGWKSYESLAEAADAITTQFVLDNVNNTFLPTAFFTDESLIDSVTEIAPEVIDGVNLRVFEVELNSLGLIIERTPQAQELGLSYRLEGILESVDLLAASDLSASYRLWIGQDDQLIYQGMLQEAFYIPYLSSGYEDEVPYDMTTTTTIELTISQHGTAAEIEPVLFAN